MPALNIHFDQLGAYLQRCTGAESCCIALSRAGSLRLVCAIGDGLSPAAWHDIVGGLVDNAQEMGIRSIVHQEGQIVVLPLATGAMGRGYALLLFHQQPPKVETLQAAVDLMSYSLREAQRVMALRHRTVQLERQQAVRMREIKNSRNYLRGIIDNIAVGLLLVDSDGTVRAINSTLARRFGCEPAEMVGIHYNQRLDSWEQSAAARTLASGQPAAQHLELLQPDGSRALIAISSFPLLDTSGTIQRAVEVWDDITKQTAMHNQLVRVEKLAAIGQLAASVAHEVGNPLQAIQGFIALFLESCPPTVANRYYLQVAEQEIERVARVVARLRDFYRPSADTPVPVQINQIMDDVLLLTSKQLQHSKVNVECQFALNLPSVLGVADQLKQVILNLVLNAIESMPDGGQLTVITSLRGQMRGVGQKHDQNADSQSGEPVVEICVADTGIGIAPERLNRLFDGLQTTKARGMGLGLYTSKAIIDRHMGRIAVDSNPGQGTTFTITLPVRREEL